MPSSRLEDNKLLARLAPAILSELRPQFEPCEFSLRQKIYAPGERNEHAYFPTSGLVSVLTGPKHDKGVEVGVVGREGMLGLPIVLRSDRSPHDVFVQMEGAGWRIPAGDFRAALTLHSGLLDLSLRYAHYFLQQVSGTAYANAHFTVDERLARWLLLCHDRRGGADLPFTHEFLAVMLGVHRPGVTNATRALEQKGFIKARRGWITVLDRPKLEGVAGSSYGLAEHEYARIFGTEQ